MGIYVPLELLSGILIILIALGQLLRPLKFRNLMFTMILFEMGYLHLLHMYIIYNRNSLTYYSIFPTAQPVFMSLGVFIYFYILSVKDETQKIDKSNIRHFYPAIISVILMVLFYFITAENPEILKQPRLSRAFLNFMFIASWISLATYITLSINQIRMALKRGNPVHRVFRYLMFLLLMSFPAMVTGIITSMSEWPKGSPFNIIYILINSFIVFGLFLLMQRNPYLVQYGSLPVRSGRGSAAKSHLANVDIATLRHNLEIIMEEEKLYCDEDLSLARLSEALEVTTHQLSQYLNEHHSKNFNCYINSYRIRDAKRMLIDDRERSALSIAYAVGFNSYSSFYTVFRKEVNLSPAEFRKNHCKS